MPDISGLTQYVSGQVSAVLFIVMIVMIVRAFISQRWGMFFSSFIFAVICYVIVANPGEFESLANAIWHKIKSGGLS
ncbi:TcpD family membrane protein [Bacillus salipaludis]|uniref:TcpD family membrane protein n=1 Tax=Bacillus salipaludis TaxID=2547811 RepID=A0AA90TWZ4_9BACI|nr:TcpD family membrane protein [Bacillus salipaludis]MDQ6600976.1 TcpD family membrane protein [Bacillus salipaludis]